MKVGFIHINGTLLEGWMDQGHVMHHNTSILVSQLYFEEIKKCRYKHSGRIQQPHCDWGFEDSQPEPWKYDRWLLGNFGQLGAKMPIVCTIMTKKKKEGEKNKKKTNQMKDLGTWRV